LVGTESQRCSERQWHGPRECSLRKRLVALITAVLAVALAAAAMSMAVTGTADAAPPESHYVATWNMQGSSHSEDNKWNTGVAQMMTAYRLLALQEAGTVPDSANHVQDHTFTGPGGQQWTVREYTWGGTSTRPGSFIYWLQTDPNGNRVNLAVVSAQRADDITVVGGPYRPALGIRVGDGFYFTVHASSSGGGDAPTLLTNIDNAVSQLGQAYSWVALGDFNREPQAGGLPFVVCPPAAPTYPATNPTQYYDFMVRGSGVQLSGHVLAIQLSDHLPARFSFPPTALSHQVHDRDLRVLPLGDSITYGVGSSDGNSYRDRLLSELAADQNRVDFVGSQRSGTMADPDNEGHSGALISEIDGYEDPATTGYRPNVVLVHAGTNDTNRATDPDGAPQRLGHLIDDIVAHAPDAVVVVATIVPNASPDAQNRVEAFNEAIPALVDQRVEAGEKVVLASMDALTTADLGDGLHPNDEGYAKMADAWYGALQQAAGIISDPVSSTGDCSDAANRWIDRGQIATGVGAPANSVRFADIDGDGRDDYLVLHDNGALDAWINAGGDTPGQPGWIPRGQIASGVGAPAYRVQLADIDGDRRDDYLVVHDNGAVDAWINAGGDTPGQPGWVPRGQIASGVPGASPATVRFADVNGDGRDDYLVVQIDGGPVTAWLNAGGDTPTQPGWIPRGQIATGTGAAQVELADFDCDPRDDYLTVDIRSGAVQAYLNRGGDLDRTPGWIARGQVATGVPESATSNITFADIDGDGRDDYLLLQPDTGAVHAYLNNGGDPA